MNKPLETEPAPQASTRPLVVTFVALILLTAISYGVSHFSFGWGSTAIALLIAAVKAGLVLYAFMELPMASTPARIVVLVTLSFIALLCAGVIGDIGVR
jgi:cytochrome c oxidase subunit 4